MRHIIRCPHCQAEYLPAEIYLPSPFLGRPKDIKKDANGKILEYMGTDMDTLETYRCDFCDRQFTVEANIRFATDSKSKEFGKKHKTVLAPPSLFLSEE